MRICLTLLAVLALLVGPASANPSLSVGNTVEGPLEAPRSAGRKAPRVRTVLDRRGRALNRKVLAVYHSTEEASPEETRIHKFLEMPLNHLGYEVDYIDLAKGLPKSADIDGVAAVVTWFEDDVPGGEAYLAWAARTARDGMRFIIMESFGARDGPGEMRAITPLLKEIGLEPVDVYVSDTGRTKLKAFDRSTVALERPLPSPITPHRYVRLQNGSPSSAPKLTKAQAANSERIKASNPSEMTPLLSVSAPRDATGEGGDAVLVAAGPRGGYVAAGFAINWDEKAQRVWWGIDPIGFLQRALPAGPRPIPDVTTLAGRRIYFSHIDGDSWNSISGTAKHRGKPNAEVVLQELILPFPDLPVTVGLISCDIDPALKGKPGAEDIARRLYALPQVEAASHSHTHPFDWSFFASYSRERENRLVASLADPKVKYGSLPRYSVERPFELDIEIAGSLAAVERLSPPGKRPQLYLWSGDTKPFEAAVRATRKAGVRNMNGGDTRFDTEWPSIAYVKPIGRAVGAERQIYAANSNENTYTNEWTGPFDGFKTLSETHDRTESPRRLKPVNVYYHMYSGEHDGSLAAVRAHLDRARESRVIPIAASRYAAIADSFPNVRLVPLGAQRWRVENRGVLNTLRFDDPDLAVDFARSEGVLGQTWANRSLYVALDPAAAIPVVAVIDRASARTLPVHVVDSRWSLSSLKAANCEITARADGFGAGEITLAGVPPGRYWADVVSAGQANASPVRTVGLVAGPDGTLSMRLEGDARRGADIRIACAN